MSGQVRFHDHALRERLTRARTAFVSGPRQVGKTTTCRALSPRYLDWNQIADRLVILRGPEAVARHLELDRSREREVTLVIDNLQGHRGWKSFLRKFNARYAARVRLVVTMLAAARPWGAPPASSFVLRINPWTVGECARTVPTDSPIKPPAAISDEDWSALLEHGGYPEPFRRRDPRFTRRWQARRRQELIEHDLPGFASARAPAVLQMLALLLAERSATPLIYSELSRELDVAVDTVRRWIDLLVEVQHGFWIRPWFASVPKALRKEPRWFLRDWSCVTDPLARRRTFIACHLLKAVQGWADLGFGRFELRYVRDKLKREVDFLVLRERRPWFLVDVAGGEPTDGVARPALGYFQQCTRARHAFHVVWEEPFSESNCFELTEPAAVSARTLLSQLL